MKSKIMIAVILALFTALGAQCVNESFDVALNIPISGSFVLPAGATSFNQPTTVNLETVAGSYDELSGGTIYDVRIKVSPGRPGRTLSGASGSVNSLAVFTIPSTVSWDHFLTERSALNDTLIRLNQANLATLAQTLFTKPLPTVTLSAAGTLSEQSVTGDTFTVTIYAQANGTIRTN